MNPELVKIFDQALSVALWVFLASLATSLLFVISRLHHTRSSLAQYDSEEMEGQDQNRLTEAFSTPRPSGPDLESDSIIRTLLLALAVSTLCFVVLLFTPVSYFPNLATGHSWKVIPLRLTALDHHRSYRGFSVRGEVWNQTPQPIENLQAVITVWSNKQGPTTEIVESVRPRSLSPGSVATFRIRYRQDSPLLHGYQVGFRTGEGVRVPHLKGFDVP